MNQEIIRSFLRAWLESDEEIGANEVIEAVTRQYGGPLPPEVEVIIWKEFDPQGAFVKVEE